MNNKTRQLVYLAFLSALSCILYAVEIPIGPILKFDLSDLPVLVAGLWFGFSKGVSVAFVKNVIHALFLSSNPNLVGELANFMYIFFLLGFYCYFNSKENLDKYWIITLIISIVGSSALMHLFNYYVSFPLYGVTENRNEMLLTTFLPVNLIKGSVLLISMKIFAPYLTKVKNMFVLNEMKR